MFEHSEQSSLPQLGGAISAIYQTAVPCRGMRLFPRCHRCRETAGYDGCFYIRDSNSLDLAAARHLVIMYPCQRSDGYSPDIVLKLLHCSHVWRSGERGSCSTSALGRSKQLIVRNLFTVVNQSVLAV
jgi:hypothetical protein